MLTADSKLFSYTGPNPATSKENFERWVHGIISRVVPARSIIVDATGNAIFGQYQQLTPGHLVLIMSAFTPFSQWSTDLEAPGGPGSLGKIIHYNGAGNRCKATVANVGPFIN